MKRKSSTGAMEEGAITWHAASPEELSECALRLLEELSVRDDGATVLALYGELGAGKTAFVQELARHLGVSEHVTSPTFVIMKSYSTHAKGTFRRLVHIDAYRIEGVRELDQLHFTDVLLSPATLVCIEWADRIESALPEGTIRVSLFGADSGVRTITYAKS